MQAGACVGGAHFEFFFLTRHYSARACACACEWDPRMICFLSGSRMERINRFSSSVFNLRWRMNRISRRGYGGREWVCDGPVARASVAAHRSLRLGSRGWPRRPSGMAVRSRSMVVSSVHGFREEWHAEIGSQPGNRLLAGTRPRLATPARAACSAGRHG